MARQQLQVLHALDVARTQRYHAWAVVIAGMGFFADAYDIFCITLVTKLLGRIYYQVPGQREPGMLPRRIEAAINGVTFCGMIVGQLLFGWLGDKARFNPPAYAEDHMASVPPQADYVWRIILMVGAIPAVFTYRWRVMMPETARYTALVARDAEKAARDMSKVLKVEFSGEQDKIEGFTKDRDYGVFSRRFARRHGWHLVGAVASWFVLDIVFYSQIILQEEIFRDIKWIPEANSMSALEEAYRVARAQAIIALCGTLPGYWFTIAFVDVVGRKAIQFLGFTMMKGLMLVVAGFYHQLTQPGRRIWLVVMYAFTFFFANFGPNSTTFIIPAEIFPAHVRTTCHGISSAAGKVGAIVGTFGFLYASQRADGSNETETGYPSGIGVRASLFVLAACNVLGIIFTCLLPEPNGRSLEEVSGEPINGEDADLGDSKVLPL
uniref:H(+)/Pi cotransporter n=1 Tax=Aegilops tauschii TaxID=37682 RepID=M8D9G0_AEGTA